MGNADRAMILAGALAVLLPLTASAQAPTTPAAATAPTKPAKKICRSEATTGSNLGGERRCMTAAEWALESRAEQSRNADRNRQITRPGTGGY